MFQQFSSHHASYGASDTEAPRYMSLSALVRHSLLENEHFQRGQLHNPHFAYELCRRALVERDDAAWAQLFALYTPTVERWVRRCGAFAQSGESAEFFVSAAFTRLWRAITAERFASFPSLGALLLYLRRCAECVVIDSARGRDATEQLSDDAADELPDTHSPDEQALERIDRAEFWRYVLGRLNGEAERVVICRSFLLGMRPGDIYHHRQDLFASIDDVYSIRRNVIKRLGRDETLRQMFA